MQNLINDPFQFKESRKDEELFSEDEIKYLCEITVKSEINKDNVVKLNDNFSDVLIIGDIHGDFTSLTRITRHFIDGKVNSLLFLGDYVDRGKDALLVICYLFTLNQMYPEHIQLLRGNHEDQQLNLRYGFSRELSSHYPDNEKKQRIHDLLDQTFNFLSLSAITPKNSMCMHGGIPNGNPTITEINQLPKPHFNLIREEKERREHLKSIMDGILWNDPSQKISKEFVDSPRGYGFYLFSEEANNKFLDKNHLSRIIRAHESSRGGFEKLFAGRLLHIFSTEPYFGQIEKAYVLHESKKLTVVRDLDFEQVKTI